VSENRGRVFDVKYFTATISHLLSICGKLNISVAAIVIAVKGVYSNISYHKRTNEF
jgi:hypothetical protein